MNSEWQPFTELLSKIVDNRGKTCPVGNVGIPLIATNCIDRSNLYPSYNTTRFVSEETHKTWFRGHPLPGDILFVCKGSPGRTNWVPDPVDFCIAQDMVAVRANPKKIYPKYLFAALRSSIVQDQIDSLHVGTMIPHFKKGDFDKLKIPMVCNDSQKIIGDFYFTLSERIALLRETNTTLEAIAQTLFKSWFVDFDPVHAKQQGREPEGIDSETAELFPDSFEKSELGLVPSGWKYSSLKEAVTIFDSKRIPLAGQDRVKRQGPYPYYGAAALMDHVDDYLFDGIYFLMGEDGSVANSEGFPITQYVWGKIWVNNHAHVLQGNNGISTEHLMLYVKQININPYITGAVQAKLSQSNMWRIPFLMPRYEISIEFGKLICPLFNKIRHNSDQIMVLAELRDTLLPRLISGKLRLPNTES